MRVAVLMAAVCVSMVGLAAADEAKAAIRKDVNIPAEGMGPALQTFAKTFNFQVLYHTEVVGQLNTQGAIGTLSADEALKQLLKGTGLTYEHLDQKTITIISTSQIAPDGAPPISSSDPGGSTPDDVHKEGKGSSSGSFLVAQMDQGQTSGPGPVADQSSGQISAQGRVEQLAEVTVTGRRPLIETNVTLGAFGNRDALDIPLSIESLPSTLIQNTFSRNLVDITAYDPAVQDDRINSDYSNLGIRGFATDWTNTVRRNGLNLAPYQDVPMEGVEAITVLKGPSGFLYGFNAPGGTINFVTKEPTRDPFTEVTLQAQSYAGWYANVENSNTLGASKDLGYRINVGHEQVGNDYDHNGDFNRTYFTGSMAWKVSEKLVVRLNGDYQKKENAAQPVINVLNNLLPPYYDPRTLLGQPWLQYETDTYNVGARLDYQFGPHWSATAEMAYSSNTRYAAFPRIGAVMPNGNIVAGTGTFINIDPDQTYRVGSGQVFVTGDFDTGSVKNELVTGFSWESWKARELGYIVLPISVGNIFNPVYTPEPTLPPAPERDHNDVIQSSPFVSDLVTFSERWQALLGARYIHFDNSLSLPGPAPATTYVRDEVVPNVGLMYRPTPNIMTYADYTQGLQQSAIAPLYAVNGGIALAPIPSTQYEVGAKAAIGKINTSVAIFQISKALEYVNSSNVFVQEGSQRHRGVELSVNGQLSDNLSLLFGVSRLFTTQINSGQATVNGKRTPNAPDWQGVTRLEYRVPHANGLFVDGTLRYVGDRAVDPVNLVIAPGFTTLDLGARYVCVVFHHNMIFRATLKNVTDKIYWASADSTGVFPGEPRTAYVQAQLEF